MDNLGNMPWYEAAWDDVTSPIDTLSSWTNSLFSPYENDTAQNTADPYFANGGLSQQDINEIDGGDGSVASMAKTGKNNPGQNTKAGNPSRTISSAITSALGMAAGMGKGRGIGNQAHAASSAFHYQSGMNPVTIMQNTANTIKDTSNPLNVFNALKAK